jgi:hypothetical protein
MEQENAVGETVSINKNRILINLFSYSNSLVNTHGLRFAL